VRHPHSVIEQSGQMYYVPVLEAKKEIPIWLKFLSISSLWKTVLELR